MVAIRHTVTSRASGETAATVSLSATVAGVSQQDAFSQVVLRVGTLAEGVASQHVELSQAVLV